VKILKNGLDGFAGKIFDLKAGFHFFEMFFDAPARMVEVGEKGMRKSGGVQKGSHQDLFLTRRRNETKKADGEGVHGKAVLSAFGERGRRGLKCDPLFRQAGSEEALHDRPGGIGDPSTEGDAFGEEPG